MSAGIMLRPDFFRRAAIIDAELGWPRNVAAGRLAALYLQAQQDEGTHVVKRRIIVEWSGVEPEHADRFIDACCKAGDEHVHFLEPRDGDRFLIVGNAEQVERRNKFHENRVSSGSKGGKQRAKNAAAKKAEAEAQGQLEGELEANAEVGSSGPSSKIKPVSVTTTHPREEEKNLLSSQPENPEVDTTSARARVDPEGPLLADTTGLAPAELVAIWNTHRGDLAPTVIRDLTCRGWEEREHICALLAAHPEPSFWIRAVEAVVASPFLRGQVSGKDGLPFTGKLSLAWLLDGDRAERAVAGDFGDRGKPKRPRANCRTCKGTGIAVLYGIGWTANGREVFGENAPCPTCIAPNRAQPQGCSFDRASVEAELELRDAADAEAGPDPPEIDDPVYDPVIDDDQHETTGGP